MTTNSSSPLSLVLANRPSIFIALALSLALAILAIAPFRAEARRPRLPEIRLSTTNQVPVCVTPQRLTAYMHTRNRSPKLRRLYKNIAFYYRKHGEELGVRWDYAFFQMLIETNYLTYRTGRGRWGDVKTTAFNFAGIGTTGGGVPGNTFPNVSTGVKAQIQHLIAYSGEYQRNPTAARTRLKQRDIIEISRKLRRPVRFDDLAGRWAVDRKYANSIEWVARRFRKKYCTGRMLQIAKAQARQRAERRANRRFNRRSLSAVPAPRRAARPRYSRIAPPAPRRAVRPHAARPQLSPAGKAARRAAARQAAMRRAERARQLAAYHKRQRDKERRTSRRERTATKTNTAFKAQRRQQRSEALARKALTSARRNKNNRRSALGAPPRLAGFAASSRGLAASPKGTLRPRSPNRCAVVTASYGGRKTLLIKARSNGTTTYTALTVLTGFEQSMTTNFLRSNARGGKLIGEFGNQQQALQRAFALCPEK